MAQLIIEIYLFIGFVSMDCCDCLCMLILAGTLHCCDSINMLILIGTIGTICTMHRYDCANIFIIRRAQEVSAYFFNNTNNGVLDHGDIYLQPLG